MSHDGRGRSPNRIYSHAPQGVCMAFFIILNSCPRSTLNFCASRRSIHIAITMHARFIKLMAFQWSSIYIVKRMRQTMQCIIIIYGYYYIHIYQGQKWVIPIDPLEPQQSGSV